MSLALTKIYLVQLLNDADNKVLALSGKWGTGKSHLWNEVKNASLDEKVKGALYVSLFGLSSIDQIKKKLIEAIIPGAEANPGLWATAKQSVSAGVKVLEGFHKGFGALSDISLIFAPTMLRNKVIVLDDIERKHEKLNIDEVMGFIDEFTQQHSARVVLILNSDQLSDKLLWDVLREKVIDQEVRLDTTSSEAFDIALELAPSHYAPEIKKTIETCGVTNIRIIRKTIKAVNRILEGRVDLSAAILARVVPSTVLLAATYYKGLDNGPDIDFILTFGGPDNWGDYGKKAEDLDAAGKLRTSWRILLLKLGINSSDEYENIVADFLGSGLFDAAEVRTVIDRYVDEAEVMRVRNFATQFRDHVIWHHEMTNAELLSEAKEIAKSAKMLNAATVTFLHKLIAELPEGQVSADALLSNWIADFKSKPHVVHDFDNITSGNLHPSIQALFDEAKASALANVTVFEACKYVAENNAWGKKQESAMKAATVQDFEHTIRDE